MLEARLEQAGVLKKLLDAVKELVNEANFDCNDEGISLQAMDNSHVALVAVLLKADGFEPYRCDRNMPLGVSLGSLTKILKCARDDDIVTIKANDTADTLGLQFEDKRSDRISEFEMKLMDIDQEHLGIPDTTYDAVVRMPSSEFARICKDLVSLGESVRIEADKNGVRFFAEGDIGSASVTLKQGTNAGLKPKEEDEEMESEDDEEGGSGKRKASKKAGGSKKKSRTFDDDDDDSGAVSIELQQAVSLTFSLKYLQNFAKSAPLAPYVVLNMSNEVPLLVEFDFKSGYIRYYLAPKIGEEET